MPVDAAFADLLANPRMALREPPAHIDISVLRHAADAFLAAGSGPALNAVTDLMADEQQAIPLRLYRPTADAGLPVIVFIHGGGFVFGSIETHDAVCRILASRSGAAVLSIGYCLAPEFDVAFALDDCLTAVRWLIETAPALKLDSSRLAIVGDSAGGYLAICTAMAAAREGILLRHMGLLYPMIDPHSDTPSAREFAEGYMLTRGFVEWCWRVSNAAGGQLACTPLGATRADLPPTTVVTAQYDMLRDEGEAFASHLKREGIATTLCRYDGMIHGFAGFPQRTSQADEAIRQIASACANSLENHTDAPFPDR